MNDIIRFFVNDNAVEVEADNSDMSLVDYLHEYQNLTGTKFSCGIGVCRACTVIIKNEQDDALETTLSCSVQLSDLESKKIYTVESIGSENDLAPLQKAFLEHFSFQCGYCAPGFLMAATAMLDHIKRTSIEESQLDDLIDEWVGSNLCRCTGYVRYINAIKEVALNTIKL